VKDWAQTRPALLLTAATLLCLLPFSGRAFHVDDPLFVWSAQQIVHHPGDPYGFQLIWDITRMPMSEVTKNPPLACYYAAAIGAIAGWSERALHLGFLLPTLALVLGTYRLARRFTQSPLIAAAATLLTPGVLVSASSVMCDTLMLAFWIWAAIFWVEGLDPIKPHYLAASGLLMAASALTKYFGVCLLPLLFAYSLARQRRLGPWVWYFVIPIGLIAGYQAWTYSLYGHGMLSDALKFAPAQRAIIGRASVLANALVCLSFAGGCTLPALTLAPLLWPRKHLAAGLFLGLLGGVALTMGWIDLGSSPQAQQVAKAIHEQWRAVGLELTLTIGAGIAILSIAIADLRKRRDADSLFLSLWVLGTFIFAGFLNWTINVRSVLPLVPAVGILLARRLDARGKAFEAPLQKKVALALVLSAMVSFWVAQADAELANSARKAANILHQHVQKETGTAWFQGHWGFQYYMEQAGLRPVDFQRSVLQPGDLLVIPENSIETFKLPQQFMASAEVLEIKLEQPVTTMGWSMGAGFYFSYFGPLPYAFGAVPAERYFLFRIGNPIGPGQWPGLQGPQS